MDMHSSIIFENPLLAKGSLSLENVSVEFAAAGVIAAQGINLNISPGEFISIVGPSGCGKTTLLNYAAGLLPRDVCKGRFLVEGESPVAGNHSIAYMLARDALSPWRTALGNAELGLEIRGVDKATRRARAIDLLEKVGLKGFENAFPKVLSHGMRQRVALARTFALGAPILLMDEPFGALDAQTKLQLEDVLMALWQKFKSTVVFITHDLAEAVSMSDRVIVMSSRPGRIVADVPIDLDRPRSVRALQSDPRYHEIYSYVWNKLEEGMAS